MEVSTPHPLCIRHCMRRNFQLPLDVERFTAGHSRLSVTTLFGRFKIDFLNTNQHSDHTGILFIQKRPKYNNEQSILQEQIDPNIEYNL